MSGFLANVLRRGAGLAPVVQPRPPALPPELAMSEDGADVGAREISAPGRLVAPPAGVDEAKRPASAVKDVTTEVAAAATPVERRADEARITPAEPKEAAPVSPARPIVQVVTESVNEAPVRSVARDTGNPAVAPVPRWPALVEPPALEASVVEPAESAAREPSLPVAASPPIEHPQRWAEPKPRAPLPEPPVRVFETVRREVEAPALVKQTPLPVPQSPGLVVESRLSERSPSMMPEERPEPSIEVKIGQIEIQPPREAPPRRIVRRQPRGFKDQTTMRRYQDRRWY